MNRDHITERTISIYLQIAETARFSADTSLVNSMLLAAHDQVNNCGQKVDLNTLIRLAEFLVMAKLTKQAEGIFNSALKKIQAKENNSWLRARIYDGLAEVHVVDCRFDKAIRKYEQAIKIMSALPHIDPLTIVSRRRKLALLNLRQGDLEKARALLQ